MNAEKSPEKKTESVAAEKPHEREDVLIIDMREEKPKERVTAERSSVKNCGTVRKGRLTGLTARQGDSK